VALVASHNTDQDEQYTICKMDERKYSSLRKLLRIAVYCLKFIKQLIRNTLPHVSKKFIGKKQIIKKFITL